MNRIEFEIDESGKGKVILNGEDISNKISAISITSKVGEMPVVDLTCNAAFEGEILGIVK